MFTAVDRYLRVKYLERYSEVFTKMKFFAAEAVVFIIVVTQTVIMWIGPTYLGPGQAAKLTSPLNCLATIVAVTCYFLAIKQLKDYSKTQQEISTEIQRLVQMASMYVLIFTPIYLTAVVYQFSVDTMLKNLDRVTVSKISIILYTFPSMCGSINAVAFLLKNRPCRQFVRAYAEFRMQRFRGRINPEVLQS